MSSSAKPLKTNAKAPPGTGGSATSASTGTFSSKSGPGSGRSEAPPLSAASGLPTSSGSVYSGSTGTGNAGASGVGDITSPHELTAFVENLLERLDTKFDDMSAQLLERMTQMSSRVDALENSIQDIINGDVSSAATPIAPQATGASVPQSPSMSSLGAGSAVRRTGSAQV